MQINDHFIGMSTLHYITEISEVIDVLSTSDQVALTETCFALRSSVWATYTSLSVGPLIIKEIATQYVKKSRK